MNKNINTKTQSMFNKKIPFLINDLNERLIERDELSRLVILSICSHNHMFLIGDRGVAKSMTVELINDVIDGAKFWQLQVGDDTKIEELFGEKRADNSGAVQYVSKNSILHSTFVVLDEMFKARGELLNALLEILVEGAYTSGDGKKRQTPIISVFGTSNEYPTENKMLPYVDRFLFWYLVPRIQSSENRKRFYAGLYNKEKITKQYFSTDDLYLIKEESKKVSIPFEIVNMYENITTDLIKQAVKTSDRKYDRTLNTAMKTSAYLNGRDEIDISDLFILLHTSWHDAFERDKVTRLVFEKIFGATEEIQKNIVECSKAIDEIDTYKNSNLFDFLYYKKHIEGRNKNNIFEQVTKNIKEVLNAYQNISNNLLSLVEKYNFNKKIEKMLERNLFLFNYKQNSFSEDMLKKINTLLDALDTKKDALVKWLEESRSIFEYQSIISAKEKESA